MKRQLVVVGLAVAVLLLFAFISATVAAPRKAQLFPTTEQEPNNDYYTANPVNVPGYVIGSITNMSVEETDFFTVTVEVGRPYQASLTINSPQGLQLRLNLYDGNRNRVGNPSSASSSYTSLSWTGSTLLHYVRVEAVTVSTSTLQTADYRLDIDEIAQTPTPTNTPLPGADAYEYNQANERNNSRDKAYILPIAASAGATDVNFYPSPDEDWFAFYVKSGRHYRASTGNLTGVDTFMEVYAQDGSRIISDNDGGGGFASKAEWESSYDGYYYVRVTNLVTSGSEDTYDLTVAEISAPPTATPEPTEPGPTPIPGMDSFEPNYDFAHASTIAANVTYSANFIPWSGGTEDNDFFKIWIKPGLHFICATSELAPGVDTNIIVYDSNRNAIGGNDDVTLGDYSSRFAYFSTYEGWLYVLVGHGGRLPMTEVKDSTYKMRCDMQVPGQATATSTPEEGEAPPPPATQVPPPPTSRPPEELTVRPLTTPTPASAVTPAPRFIPITLLVYYDAKDDRQPGAGEGIAGISAQAYDATTNQLLAQGFTDEQGNLQFTVSAQGPVRVAVPFFGFSQLVAGEGASIYLRVPPQPLPGGAP